MSVLTAEQMEAIAARHPEAVRPRLWRRARAPLVGAAIALYLVLSWWFLGVGQVLSGSNWELAGAYLLQWVTYENRPTVAIDPDGAMQVSFPRFDPIGPDPHPDWMTLDRTTMTRTVAPQASASASAGGGFMAGGAAAGSFMAPAAPVAAAPAAPTTRTEEVVRRADVRMSSTGAVAVTPTMVVLTRGDSRVEVPVGDVATLRANGPLPDWIVQKRDGDRMIASFGLSGWVQVDTDAVVVHKRFLGWANFIFDTYSPFFGKSAGEVWRLMVSGERIDPAQSNLALAVDNFLYNSAWQHLDVWTKLLETIVMAFIGTLFAALIAFPLSFIAARNITRHRFANQATKRFFDFQRSVDMLIWALFFTRAFGPGPISGMAAIFFTDTGSLGKLFSEALENIDGKPPEGMASVGAAPIAVQRFGVLPQVLPVFVSQTLYFWESNTRSATIIGAMGAGGIGLKLWEAMRTHTNWPNIFYMVLLIIGTVFIFDTISNALRSRLIGRAQH